MSTPTVDSHTAPTNTPAINTSTPGQPPPTPDQAPDRPNRTPEPGTAPHNKTNHPPRKNPTSAPTMDNHTTSIKTRVINIGSPVDPNPHQTGRLPTTPGETR